MSNLFKSPK
jgi:hypothetical protein